MSPRSIYKGSQQEPSPRRHQARQTPVVLRSRDVPPFTPGPRQSLLEPRGIRREADSARALKVMFTAALGGGAGGGNTVELSHQK